MHHEILTKLENNLESILRDESVNTAEEAKARIRAAICEADVMLEKMGDEMQASPLAIGSKWIRFDGPFESLAGPVTITDVRGNHVRFDYHMTKGTVMTTDAFLDFYRPYVSTPATGADTNKPAFTR